MSFRSDEIVIRQTFKAAWGATTEVFPANPQDAQMPTNQEFVIVGLQPGEEDVAGIGTSRWRHVGAMWAQVFVPKGTGMGRLLELVDIAKAIFQGKTIQGVRFRRAEVALVGVTSDAPDLFQATLRIPFIRDRNS